MGIQTMGSQTDHPHHHQLLPLPLSRQNSYYTLTLDEVENQLGLGGLGKPLGSMNLDELLKNVCTADENDATSALQQQPSLSKKTVEEVWRDIQRGQEKSGREKEAQDRQPTLGEMTLEDFLVKAGVVSQNSDESRKAALDAAGADLMISTPQAQWLQYQLPSVQPPPQQQHPQQNMMGVYMPAHPVPQSLPIAPTSMETAYPENQMAISSPLMGTLSDTQTPGRKRGASGDMMQKTVERRQKRMIKNRESAARSRARKQAYTNELENKVTRLETENALLKKQKEMEMVLPNLPPPPEPKFQLRRTSSARF